MIASSGDPLLEPDAVAAYQERLFPLATLITPNLDELYFLASAIKRPVSLDELKSVGYELLAKTKRSLLLKGGHLHIETATDLLLLQDGTEYSFSAPFLRDVDTHGTGCTYAAAITAFLAQGNPLPQAVAMAKKVITNAIAHAYSWNHVSALHVTSQ
jgi:hydroxymethylpyrimidine/phosphomethylpyrimidine kinase